MASNCMPVTFLNASEALRSVCSGALASGWPSLSKNEHSIDRVGISANGSRNAVRKRGST